MFLKKIDLLALLVLTLFTLISFSQVKKSSYTDRTEILNYFEKNQNKELYQAAVFLTDNISNHYSVSNIWLDEKNNPIKFEATKFKDIEQANQEFTILKKEIGIKPQKKIIHDIDVIDKKMLIKNIELAYYSWKNNPWSKDYDFKTFCEYILPYRSITEPIEDWRSEYQLAFEKLSNDMQDPNDPVELCSKVIENLKHFDFVINRFDPKPFLGPNELLFWRQGTCQDLANVALFASRALGVAVTFDYTPHFAASSNRHYWNTVIDKKGINIPFNGNQNYPYAWNPNSKRMGKVYRVTYSEQPGNLASIIPESEIPNELKSKNILDVTSEYVEVSDINYTFNSIENAKIGYINVFNVGEWRPIFWSKINNKNCIYKNMGRDIVYLPGVFKSGKMKLVNYPVLVDKKGKATILEPNFKDLYTANLSRSNEEKSKYTDNNTFQIMKGEKYQLLVWNQNWQLVEEQTALEDDHINYTKVPKNGLFLIAPLKPNFFERIFTINPATNTITWY